MDLGDVEWGDVLSDADGMLVVEGRVADTDVLVLRFADAGDADIVRRGLEVVQGGPELQVLADGDGWMILEQSDGLDRLLGDPDA